MEPMKPMAPMEPMQPMKPMAAPEPWWPAELGHPASTGAQDGLHYAVFPDRHRVVVRREGTVTAYDTGHRRLDSASQSGGGLVFSGPDGEVRLDELTAV